jgi:hypothetical protein
MFFSVSTYHFRLTTYGQLEMAQDRLEECVWSPRGKGSSHSKAELGRHPDQELVVFCCRGKLWLEERTPEQLKGEGS